MITKAGLDYKAVAVLACFSVLGFFGNALHYELFFNVDVIFGSIFAILAVRLYGFYGVIPAFIASTYSYVLWNHPYAIIIFTTEAAFVAAFRTKFKNTVFTDMVYWIALGIPTIFLTYYMVMGMEINTMMLIMMKQSVNGIFNALIAMLVFDLIRMKLSKFNVNLRISYQYILFQTIILLIIVPMVMYLVINVRASMSYTTQGMHKGLNNMVSFITSYTHEYRDNTLQHVKLMEAVTRHHYFDDVAMPISKPIDHHMETSNGKLLNVILLNDRMETIYSYNDIGTNLHPQATEHMKKVHGWGRRNPVFSDMFLVGDGEREERVPAIYSISRLEQDGRSIYMLVFYNLNTLKDKVSSMLAESDIEITMLDHHAMILYSTMDRYRAGDIWVDREDIGELASTSTKGICLWTPDGEQNVSVMKKWRRAVFTKTAVIDKKTGYTIVADMPVTYMLDFMVASGKRALTILFIMCILAVALSHMLSMRITKHIRAISNISNNLTEKIMNEMPIEWPATYIKEAVEIRDNFIHMSDKVRGMFKELRTQKDEIEAIIDSVPQMIVLKDADNRIVRINDTAKKKLFPNMEECKGVLVSDYVMNDASLAADREAIRSKRPVINQILSYEVKDGEPFSARVSRIPIPDSSGEVTSILVVAEDISSELKASEEKEMMLETMNRQSRMAEIGALLNIIVHQWKQPLNVMSLVAQTTRDDLKADRIDKDEMLNDMELLVQNTDFLAQTIADFSGYFKGGQSKSRFKACEVIKGVRNLIDKQFIKNKVAVVIDCEGDFEVNSLKNEFKQVCLNILNNANDALAGSDNDKKQISVTFSHTETEGQMIIRDNAGGINPQLMPDKIFEPYVTTKGSEGSGIGLYVCKNIVEEKMHGKLTARNIDGGAEFMVVLPLDGSEQS